jgi:hypothetical protein
MRNEEKTLKKFLKETFIFGYEFQGKEDFTLEEFLTTCDSGDLILWLFSEMNKENKRELTLAKAHCANVNRHLIKDDRSLNAIDVAIRFGNNEASLEELNAARDAAYKAHCEASSAAEEAIIASANAYNAYAAASLAHISTEGGIHHYRKHEVRKKMADICRKYLPLKIWNQSNL